MAKIFVINNRTRAFSEGGNCPAKYTKVIWWRITINWSVRNGTVPQLLLILRTRYAFSYSLVEELCRIYSTCILEDNCFQITWLIKYTKLMILKRNISPETMNGILFIRVCTKCDRYMFSDKIKLRTLFHQWQEWNLKADIVFASVCSLLQSLVIILVWKRVL